jgi:hypothetical protein
MRGRAAEAQRLQAESDGMMSRLFGERRPRLLNSPTLPVWSRES